MTDNAAEYQDPDTIKNLKGLAAFFEIWEHTDIFLPGNVCKCLNDLRETIAAELSAEEAKPKQTDDIKKSLADLKHRQDILKECIDELGGQIEEGGATI